MARGAKPKAATAPKTDPQEGQIDPAAALDPDAAGGQGPQEVRHWIEVIDPLNHDGDDYAPGDAILLTSAQFDALVKAGVVGGAWADGEAETEV